MRRSFSLSVIAATTVAVGGASLAAEPPPTNEDKQGLYDVQAVPLPDGQDVAGRLEIFGERNLFVTRLETPLTLVQVLVDHRIRGCTLDATLLDIDGAGLASAAAAAGQPQTVTALVGSAGPVFVSVEAHDPRCEGSPYTLRVAAEPLQLTEAAEGGDARAGRRIALISRGKPYLECLAWSARWERLSGLMQRTRDALDPATGARRARLVRKRRSVRRKLVSARRQARSWCGEVGLR